MREDKCRGCNWKIMWTEQCKQYGRLIRRGLTKEQIKEITPRCQKCVTELLRTYTVVTLNEDGTADVSMPKIKKKTIKESYGR